MKIVIGGIVGALSAAVLLGLSTGAAPVGQRPQPDADPADSVWFERLPDDPVAATDAFLQRIPADTRARGDAFGATRYVSLPARIVTLIGSLALILFSGAAARFRDLAQRASGRRSAQDAVFAVLLLATLFALSLPVETWASYVRMRQAGFSDMPYPAWLADLTLRWTIDLAFYVVGLIAIAALIRRRPSSWAGWATLVYGVVSALYLFTGPFTEGWFNQLSPLEDGPAKVAVLRMARANGVEVDNVFVRDASRQSGLLNAHVSGLAGSTRIVLDDNTVTRTPVAEVEIVMAHEVGHYVLAHRAKGLVFDTLIMGLGLVLVAACGPYLLRRLGRTWRIPDVTDPAAIAVLWGLFLLWGYAALPLTNGVTRQQEGEADLFALNASQQPLAQAEWMVRDADTGQLHPSPLEEWLFYDHPSPRNRILTAMKWRAEHLPDS